MVPPIFVRKPFKRHRAGVKNRIARAKAQLRWITKQNIQLTKNTEFDSNQGEASTSTTNCESNVGTPKPAFANKLRIKSVLCTHLLYTILNRDGTYFKTVGPKSHSYVLCDLTGENKELNLIKASTFDNLAIKNKRFEFVDPTKLEIIGLTFPIKSNDSESAEEEIERQNFEAFHALNLAARLSLKSASLDSPRVDLIDISSFPPL